MKVSEFLDIKNLNSFEFKVTKLDGVDTDTINKFEESLNISFPPDIRNFYLSTNGFEGQEYIFNILPLEKLEVKEDDRGLYIEFAEYLIYTETCGLEIDKNDYNKYKIFVAENGRRRYVAESIIDFISLFGNKGTTGIWGTS